MTLPTTPTDAQHPVPVRYNQDDASFSPFVVWLHWVLLVGALAVLAGILFTDPGQLSRYSTLAVLVAVLGISRWQLATSARRSVFVIAIGMWLMASSSLLMFAGVHSASMTVYPLTIALVAWAFGRVWLAAFTVVTVVFVAAVGVAEMTGWFHPTPRAGAPLITLQSISILAVIAYLSYAARQQLSASRDRAIGLSTQLGSQVAEVAFRERQLSLLLNNVPAAVASFDAGSHLRNCNERYAAMFGQPIGAILGKHIRDYVPELALQQLKLHWDKALGGEAQSYRRFNVHPQTSQVFWVDATVTPEFDGDKVVGLYAILVDVTDKVQAEAQILSMNSELEARVAQRTAELALAMEKLTESREALVSSQAKATLSALVASVSHELNSPIGNSVLVASTLTDLSRQLQQQLDSDKVRKSTLLELNRVLGEGSQLLLRNLSRAEGLLKNFKQVSADQASEQRRVFDLQAMVAEVISSMAPSLKSSPHRIVQNIPADMTMDSLPGPIGQVIINLVNNAFLHAFEGRPDGVLTISAIDAGRQVALRFADNGAGIDPAVQAKLFEPFFSTKIGRGGTGLGLSIVDSLVRKVLRGELQVQSEPGQGTTFVVLIPKVMPNQE